MNVCMRYKILQYNKICISEGIDINKTGTSKECIIYHYFYFKNVGYKLDPHVCSDCYDILMIACELKNFAILNVKGVDYRCLLWDVTKNDAVNMMDNSKLGDKGTL